MIPEQVWRPPSGAAVAEWGSAKPQDLRGLGAAGLRV